MVGSQRPAGPATDLPPVHGHCWDILGWEYLNLYIPHIIGISHTIPHIPISLLNILDGSIFCQFDRNIHTYMCMNCCLPFANQAKSKWAFFHGEHNDQTTSIMRFRSWFSGGMIWDDELHMFPLTSGSTDGEVCCIWNRFQMPYMFKTLKSLTCFFCPEVFGIPAFPTLWPRKNRDHVFFWVWGCPSLINRYLFFLCYVWTFF